MLIIRDLNKSYGKFKAVNGLSLEIDKGEIFGFVGPNGAGKSTTMKVVAGLLYPDSGEVYVDNIDAIKNNKKLKEKIGYMPDFFGVYDNLKTIEYMEFYASIYGIVGKEAKSLSMQLLELVNLKEKSEAYVDGLSRGMKQRLCLARSLVHNPELLILDEPASGMDPRARFEMKGILKNLRSMDKTIIISSHILSELGEICNTIGIIERGKMVQKGSVEDIMLKVNHVNPINLRVLNKIEQATMILREMPNMEKVTVDEKDITAYFKGTQEEQSQILKNLVNKDIPVISFSQSAGNLEDVFMKITENSEAS